MKKLLILTTIIITSIMQAKMLVPENATSDQQQQAIQIERTLQQSGPQNTQMTLTSPTTSNISRIPIISSPKYSSGNYANGSGM